MPRWLVNPMTLGIAALLVVIVLASSLAVVPETKQVVVVRLEQPIGVVNPWKPGQQLGHSGAGLLPRIPFVDRLIWIDKRVLDLDHENQSVTSTDQLRLEVDAYARFRVVDAERLVRAVGLSSGAEERVSTALDRLFGSALQNELGKRKFADLLSPERGRMMDDIQAGLQRYASAYGVQIVDVRIKHADLPSGAPLDAAFARMRSARQQQATTIRAEGQRDAQIIIADADAQAAKIYADAFNQDPKFYDFYRAMQSYRQTFAGDGKDQKGDTNLILTPDNSYLKQFEGREQ
jgi:modulator of FtsH protease HflC